ncbi:hypothetical protein ID866_9441 [Astraeus odoratus]|nr:hypothetical protein ID866_9441 [Astraeus odoratus]
MEQGLHQALLIVQFVFGMLRQVSRWATPCGGTLRQSGQWHFPQMEQGLQFVFGMLRQVSRWATPCGDTLGQSGQWHFPQMEQGLHQALLIRPFVFGMLRKVSSKESQNH